MTLGGLAEALASIVGREAVITDPAVAAAYAADHASWVEPGSPAAVVFPRTTTEVAAIVQAAREAGVSIVARGAGSGLSGGATARDDCLVLCLSRMDRVLEVDAANQVMVVQPGVLTAEVAATAARHGLWYPPDPSSIEFCSIGGNVATNAGGLCCMRYGVTADFVLAVEVVLADGSVVRTGRRTIKGVAGYDLTHLFVGSEGTLGIITEVTLRLRPPRPEPVTVVAFFSTLASAGVAITSVAQVPEVAVLELMDRTTIEAVDGWKRMELDRAAAALLVVQIDSPDDRAPAAVVAAMETAGATYVQRSEDADESAQLFAARRLAYPALERLGATLLDDVAVPRSAIPDLLATVEAIARRHRITIGTFGHAGDGNLHPTIVYDRADASARERAALAFDDIVEGALGLGGTITGEHGVGALKREWLSTELGEAALALHRTIKAALDPLHLLNPGKVLIP